MAGVTERQVYDALSQWTGNSDHFKIGKTELQVTLTSQDTHIGDSPDCILWFDIDVKIFSQDLKIRIPIPIEAEKAGLKAAVEDLDKFCDRGHFRAEIPMLVVAEEGYSSKRKTSKIVTEFKIKQVPVRLMSNSKRKSN